MTPEQRKDIRAWDPVFESNEQGLNECRVMIAVLEYAMPANKAIHLVEKDVTLSSDMCTDNDTGEPRALYPSYNPIELPDAGTVWECGYHRAQGKIVIGFHTDKAKHLNLMLTHGCDAMIRGFENLEGFLSGEAVTIPTRVMQRGRQLGKSLYFHSDAAQFDWSFTEDWDAKSKAVE
jgi:hypothetical protein